MGIRRYFDFAKEVINWVISWVQLIGSFWREIIFLVVVMMLTWKILDLLIAWTSRRKVVATVNHKERVYYPKSLNSMYLVFTDKGVFRNQDSWAYLSFNSSDTYSRIITGSTYKFTIYGYRNRWNSEYPNILKTELWN